MLTKTRKVNPGDMPDFDAAMELSYNGLIKTKASLKHCIILSDGDPTPPRAGFGEEVQRRENHGFDRHHQSARCIGGDHQINGVDRQAARRAGLSVLNPEPDSQYLPQRSGHGFALGDYRRNVHAA